MQPCFAAVVPDGVPFSRFPLAASFSRNKFPRRLHRELRCVAMDLPDLLYPLPPAALGAFLLAFREHGGNVALMLRDLQAAGFHRTGMTEAEVAHVIAKIERNFPQWLQEKAVYATTQWRRCPRCACVLDSRAISCCVLTFAQGSQPVQVFRETCASCNRVYSGCWSWTSARSGEACLERRVLADELLLLNLCPERSSMAAVDPALYAFLTASLLHVRSSFRGFAALMQDFHHFPHVEHLHDKLLYAWLVYQAVTQLQDNYWEGLQSVSFCFQRHNADLRTDTLGALYLPLQSAFLKDFAQSHQCVTCIRHPVVAFDGKVNRAVPVCCCKTGRTMHLLRGDVVLDYGCLAPRLHGSYACALHHTDAAVAKSQLQCFRGHKLRRKKHKLAIECNQCNAVISAAAPLWSCDLGCIWQLCHTCAIATVPLAFQPEAEPVVLTDFSSSDMQQSGRIGAGPPHVAADLSEATLMADAGNPCGLVKGIDDDCAFRYYGSIITALLGCGRVAMVMPIARHESLTQIFGMLAAVRSRRTFDFVVYDNACALARFTRKLAARTVREIPQLCAQVHFVLDRWHKQNHTACLDPMHSLFTPEVDMDLYPQLADFNSSLCEHFNS